MDFTIGSDDSVKLIDEETVRRVRSRLRSRLENVLDTDGGSGDRVAERDRLGVTASSEMLLVSASETVSVRV